ncbi:MAG: hypothetical protein LCH86_09795 [Proteobacteria bacterium]|nr:hypothetical protein [Pseudomonadota bacterium]
MKALAGRTIGDFSNGEIRDEYIERFGDPNDVKLSRLTRSELIDELESRDEMPEVHGIDEIADLIAEAARTSPYAVRAYELLREKVETLPMLRIRQAAIDGRMSEVA